MFQTKRTRLLFISSVLETVLFVGFSVLQKTGRHRSALADWGGVGYALYTGVVVHIIRWMQVHCSNLSSAGSAAAEIGGGGKFTTIHATGIRWSVLKGLKLACLHPLPSQVVAMPTVLTLFGALPPPVLLVLPLI